MKMLKLKTIKSKVLGIFLSITLLIFVIVGIVVGKYSSDIIFSNTQDKLLGQSLLATEQVDKFFAQRSVLVNQMETNKDIITFMNSVQSRDTVKTDPNYTNVIYALKNIRKTDSNLSLVWIALEKPNYIVGDEEWEPPTTWDIHTRPWYKPTLAKKGLFYTEPYKDSASGETVLSAIKPIYNQNNEFIGVVGIDLKIDELSTMMSKYKIGDTGYLTLVSKEGLIIYHQDESLVLKSNIKDVVTFGTQMIEGKTGFEKYMYNGVGKYVAYGPIPSIDWSVGAMISESDVLKDTLKIQKITIIIYLTSMIVLFLALSYVINRVLKNIPHLVTSIEKFASGDLTVKVNIDEEDEIGLISKALNKMGDNFQDIIGKFINSSSHIASSSEELTAIAQQTFESSENVSKTIQEIAEGASNQAKDTQIGSDRALELGELVNKDLKYMNQVNDSSHKVISLIDDGLDIIKDLTNKTDESDSAIKEVYEGILKTNKSAQHIGDASQIIASIAEQTNLLALNAAIEAARAGENGRGFAVVADEIRKLAEQSTNSTKTIDLAVSKLQGDSSVSVKTIESVLKIIEEQTQSVEFTRKQYTEISSAISESQSIINLLSYSLDEMNKKKNEILDIMEGLSSISQENAASSEEVAATTEEQNSGMSELANSSEDLSKLAQDLQEAMSKFTI